MTTPKERMRSLRWGYELLVAIQQDQNLASGLVIEARRLAQNYPFSEVLAASFKGDSRALPANFGLVIDESWRVFQQVRVSETAPHELRRHASYTLRHFPPPGTGNLIAEASGVGRIDDWLAPETDSFSP